MSVLHVHFAGDGMMRTQAHELLPTSISNDRTPTRRVVHGESLGCHAALPRQSSAPCVSQCMAVREQERASGHYCRSRNCRHHSVNLLKQCVLTVVIGNHTSELIYAGYMRGGAASRQVRAARVRDGPACCPVAIARQPLMNHPARRTSAPRRSR
jgi:hypothetical protein